MAENPEAAEQIVTGGGGKSKIPGIRKAAIFLVSIDQDLAAQVMAQMEHDDIERVSLEIARLDEVELEERMTVMEEFTKLHMANQYMQEGGLNYAKSLISRSLSSDEARDIMEILEQSIHVTPFAFLAKAEAENLLTFIQDEHPQTIALILSHVNANQAAEVLAGLTAKKQTEVVKRIANMEQTNPEVIREVESGLEQRLSAIMSQEFEEIGGVEAVADILNLVDRTTEKGILESLEENDPDLVEQIRRLMFVFEDIQLVTGRGIQDVLKEIDRRDLGLALKQASDELKEKIFSNMSERAAEEIKEEMEFMGPVRVAEVEASQQKIVDVVRRLADEGKIIIQGRGGEDEIIV